MNLKTWWQHCWLPACLFLLVAITHTVSSETRVVCYYTNWSVYRPGTAKFSPQNINPYLCTHLIYAFGGFTKENSLKPFDKYQDIEKGGYAKFTGLKTYNKNLKTMLAIGGWNEGSSRFSPMVANADRRKELVKNAVKFLRQNHFDGLDLDWEYPSFRDGGKTRDKVNYAQLVQELREEFDRESQKTGRPRLLLTMAVPAGIEYINKGYDIPKLNKYLDWMNILSYDYHSAFEPAVNHHSPLYPLEEDNEYNFDGDLNIDHTIKHYLKLGAESSKLVLGIPTYGRSYTLYNPDANELGAPADGPGDMGDATRENGYLAYYEICENLKENDWKVVQPNPDAMGPYAYKDNQWVSYDDERIVKKKSVYVVENNLGGIMFWSIDNDDFRGNCYNKPYPLIEAAKDALLTAATSKTEDNLVKPRKPTSRPRRPTPSLKKETDSSSSRVQNSGGRQSLDEVPASGGRKRIRPTTSSRSKSRNEDTTEERKEERKRPRTRGSGRRRKTTTTTAATTVTSTTPSTLPTTPMYKTPEPPTTPDPGGDFKCEEDGFFPHPRDCKKYFWCLSGPADLGIIAHQFTCPAGLYFNKAADSCDYTQNVLCNKKQKTTSTTSTTPVTTSTTTTTTAAPTTTRRAPARITAATSRTTFLYTSTSTTTEEPEYYDEEYEYDDDEDFEDNAPRRGEPDSEEDPKVIKELIDLIKKVGGVEELEKFLKLQEDGSMSVTHSGSTTPASISRSLYERVLQSRANANTSKSNTVSTKSRNSLVYTSVSRNRPSSQNEGLEKPETTSESSIKRGNSRFTPQNVGLEKPETTNESSNIRGRPQYTTITRQRASTEKTAEADNESEDDEFEDEEEEEVQTKKNRQFPSRKQTTPEYVTIRRTRPTSATEPEDDDEDTSTRSSIVRSRQRGVPGETDENDDTTQGPEYVTIRRNNRPPTDEVTTSKYTTIQRKRPSTESSDDVETTDIESSKRRSTTQSPEEASLEKEKRYRSTTLSSVDESSTLTTVNTDTTLEDNKKTTTDKETTVTENVEVKSTLEETTDSTAEKTATQTPVTELPQSSPEAAQSTTLEASTELPSTDKSNQISDSQVKETTSEKNSPSPQLFKPRPFATRTRSTTTAKPSTETSEAPAKKVSESSGIKPGAAGRPIVRKFQPGNRFIVRAQTQSTQSPLDVSNNDSSRVNIKTTTEENGVNTQETDTKQREEEFRRRISNRGRSKFTLPTSTVEPTVARRRRPQHQTATEDYEDSDYEEVQRTYRPTLLADLSSLTSADIAFRGNSNRKHIRRRPVTSGQSSTTSTTTTTEGPTQPGLKTGPRTLTLARKQISETAFGRSSRRIVTQNQKPTEGSTTESNTFNEASTKTSLFGKPRPAYSTLLRTTTTQKPTTEQITETSPEVETTTIKIKPRIKFSEAPPLVRTTEEISTDNNNEVTDNSSPNSPTTEPEQEIDSTESNSDKEYKILKPETDESNNEVTEISESDATVSSTTEVQEQSPVTRLNRFRSTTVASVDDTTTVPTTTERNIIRRIRPSTTTTQSVSSSESPDLPKINRTRKVFIANRRRPTTPISTETESSNTETIRTTVDFKRQRPSFLSLRNNQTALRSNVTRLRPVKTDGDELETNTTSESNRGLVKRIRPIGIISKIDEEERIKLSETNISENGYLGAVQNLPEDDSGKYRRRKIVRRIRPSKDSVFSKVEEDETKNRRIKITDKSVLTTEDEITDDEEVVRIRGSGRRFDSTTLKDDSETETEVNKRIRPGKDTLFSKSESIDILRSKRIRLNGKVESETENNTERDEDEEKIEKIRQGKSSIVDDETTDSDTDEQNIRTSTTDAELEHTDENTESEIQDTLKRRPISSLYKPSNDFRNRRLKLNGLAKQETTEDEEDTTNKRITTTAETPSTFRPRNLIRKFRPGLTDSSAESKVKLSAANIKFIENNRAANRTRKIIRRLRPTTTTTTEVEMPQSTITDIPVSTTSENNISLTSENIITTEFVEDEIVPTTELFVETTEYSLTTLDNTDETTFFTTEAETTTTTTTTPRPTRPSLIGRSRPAYRPRGRPVVEIRSTTPGIIPAGLRRKLIGLNKNESTTKQSAEREETEDGIIDSKLKKLYSKKQKYTPNVRSTTERLKAQEEEQKSKEEEEGKTNEEQETVATTTDNTSDKISTEKQLETTVNDQTEAIEIITTDGSIDLTTIPEEKEMSTIFNTEQPTTVNENKQSETTLTQSTTEAEIKSTTVSKTTESTTVDITPENTEIITTENNTEMFESPTTEYVAETTIPKDISEKSLSLSTTDSSNQETSTSETTTNLDSTSNEPSTTENENRQPYKPIRYKPSDRPKLIINLNRTETDNDRNDNDEPRNRKFIPSRTADQRNRSKLAYRKDSTTEKPKDTPERSFVPKGKKLERPGLQENQNIDEDEKEDEEEAPVEEDQEVKEVKEVVEKVSERSHYPTLKPVSEKFNFYPNQNEEIDEDDEGYEGEVIDDEEEEEEEPERPPLENPVIKYLQTIRNNQEVIKTTLDHPEPEPEKVVEDDYPEEQPPVEEEEEEEYEDNDEEDSQQTDEEKSKNQSTKFNIPLVNRPSSKPVQNQPNVPARVPNRPQYTPNRPVVANEPRRPAVPTGNRPFNPHEGNKPVDPNRSLESNRPVEINRPVDVNRPVDINRPVEVNRPLEPNRPSVNRPAGNRNYPRRFNKPANPTSTSTTTESLAGINIEKVNARNKNLYSKNRKANIPHPGPATSTTVNDTVSSSISSVSSTSYAPSTVETTTPKLEISQVTEEIVLEATTEQLSTLHHVFAEPDIPTTPISTSSGEVTSLSPEYTTKYNFTAAQIEAARSLERVVEINRIVEVSLKEDKVSSGGVKTRVMLEKVPTLDRIGAINRVTIIKVVDGNNETETTGYVPSNHAVTLNEIVTGKRIDTSQKIDIIAQLHAPDIDLTKMNIFNNTLEIIETQRLDDKSKEVSSAETTESSSQETVLPQVVTEISEGEKIPEGIPVHVVNGPKILDQIINDTVVVSPNQGEKKFEINSKSNVIDYSHRELDPIQIIASAQPANNDDVKQGRKLAIDSKSVVVNNHNVRPIFNEATTLPLEALFQTDSPDYNLLKESGGVTQLPSLREVVTGRGNYVDDDQDLLESRNINGRVRIRILGQDNDYTQYEHSKDPVYAPIRVLNEEEERKLSADTVTLKADVVEITRKPLVETIKIAPIEVSLSQPQTVRVPIVRVESSQSSSAEHSLAASPKLNLRVLNSGSEVINPNSVPLKRESPTYFNPEVIFGETAKTENSQS